MYLQLDLVNPSPSVKPHAPVMFAFILVCLAA